MTVPYESSASKYETERGSSLIPPRAASTTFGTCSACCDTLSGGGAPGYNENHSSKASGSFLDCHERGLLPAEIGVQTI